ncbi:hypothetical protein PT974_12226 [Cladobotryum mycophilum]|uniref:ATPase AAA-type core domain-containing protein n=1 Tax=Cladobotryum mycophilum TaxID=491253 RepID=A0ABR0S7D8_9HYPO
MFQKLCTVKDGSRLFDYEGDFIFGKKGFTGLAKDNDDDDDSSRMSGQDYKRILFGRRLTAEPTIVTPSSYDRGRYASYSLYRLPGLTAKYRIKFDASEAWKSEDKQWAQLQVDFIKEIPHSDPNNAWSNRLQLADRGTKDMLFDLVPERMDLEVDDIILGKGKGLVILLYVFLRVLEHYQGIMFLTTNQITHFDMEQIFKGFLQPLDEKRLIDGYRDILDWLKEEVYSIGFDDRQIRNIVTMALGSARAEKKYKQGDGKLTKKHLKSVVSNVGSFKRDFMVQYGRYIGGHEKLIK